MNTYNTKSDLAMLVSSVAGWFLNGFMLYIVWNAVAKATGLPTFNYWVCLAAYWVIGSILKMLSTFIRDCKSSAKATSVPPVPPTRHGDASGRQ